MNKHIYNQSQQLCDCDNSEWDNWSLLERIGAVALSLVGAGLCIGLTWLFLVMVGN